MEGDLALIRVDQSVAGGLALVTFVVFLKHRRIAFGFALVPALLMAVMPLTGLCMMVVEHGPLSMLGGHCPGNGAAGPVVSIMSLRFVFVATAEVGSEPA